MRPPLPRYTRRALLRAGARTALGLGGAALLGGCVRSEEFAPWLSSKADALGPYKALVCVFLRGGNDSYNMVVPDTAELYDLYAQARLDLAVPREQLIALNSQAADGARYGLHPSTPELAGLYGQGAAALLFNVGNLTQPTTQADYRARRLPAGLFSHSDQQDQWQAGRSDAVLPDGWAGRIADVMAQYNPPSELPLNLSIAGTNLLQRGVRTDSFTLLPAGPQQLQSLAAGGATTDLRAAFDALRVQDSDDLFERSAAQTLDRGVRLNQMLADALKSAPKLATEFPDHSLGQQLQLVARLIGLNQTLSVRRQVFYVALGGFDTHSNQEGQHPGLLQRLSQGLDAFYRATVELGLADQVTAFTASDFGRSLTVNGSGTDHGWSSHQWVVGGAVRGGQLYGRPPSLVVGGEDDTHGGRFIPQHAVDEYAATLARWFGVSDSDLGYVLPNLGRFASRDLGFLAA